MLQEHVAGGRKMAVPMLHELASTFCLCVCLCVCVCVCVCLTRYAHIIQIHVPQVYIVYYVDNIVYMLTSLILEWAQVLFQQKLPS